MQHTVCQPQSGGAGRYRLPATILPPLHHPVHQLVQSWTPERRKSQTGPLLDSAHQRRSRIWSACEPQVYRV